MRRTHFLPILAASLTAALLASGWWEASQPKVWLADRLQRQIEQGVDSEEQMRACARQLSELDRPGWQALITIQSQETQPAERIAEETLRETVLSWKSLASDEAAARVIRLSQLLAENASATSDPGSLCFLADLAEWLLRWPASELDETRHVFACEQVIRRARDVGWPRPPIVEETVASNTEKNGTGQSGLGGLSTEQTENDSISTATSAESKPDGANGPVRALIGDFSEANADRSDESAVANLPRAIGEEVAEIPITAGEQLPEAAESADSSREPALLTAVPPLSGQSAGQNGTAAEREPAWATLPLAEILHRLRDPGWGAAAEEELWRRGFDESNLRVAQAAAGAEPDARLKLVRLLPELSGIDTVGWLVHFAQDPSPRVRAGAIQLLSTGTDRRIADYLKQLDETETDNDVRAALRSARARLR